MVWFTRLIHANTYVIIIHVYTAVLNMGANFMRLSFVFLWLIWQPRKLMPISLQLQLALDLINNRGCGQKIRGSCSQC